MSPKRRARKNDPRGKLLEYSKEDLAGIHVYLVKLPPAGLAQAFYVAVLEKDGMTRYFTLELTLKESGCPSMTILGEWLPEARHKNHGCGPKPDKEEFLEAIAAHL